MRVLHLVGSEVSPFLADLSRLYAADCLRATASMPGHDPVVAHVSPGGWWRFTTDLDEASLARAEVLDLTDAVTVLNGLDLDVAVPQMFCRPGMTAYRALLELLGLPYVGNRPDVMALGAHKAHAKAVVAAAGVLVPAGEELRPGERPAVVPPAVVKPVDADNSLGISLVTEPSAYDAALAEAFAHADTVLVEDYVPLGREVRCGVLERDGGLVCLPLEEYAVDPETKPVRAYADKVRGEGGDLGLVAKDEAHAWIVDPADPVTEAVWAAARTCHRALGCRDYSLFDFRIDPQGRPWFLEAGLYCSFAKQSVIAVMADAAGLSLHELFGSALRRAVERAEGAHR